MAELQPSEVLYIPRRRRLTHSRVKNEEGNDILHVFYGEIELIFDEPDVAPLGEKLLEVERFRADEAMTWSNAAPHDWEKIRDLLQALIDQQILKPVSEAPAAATDGFPLRLGLVPEDRQPRAFNGNDPALCPIVSEEAFGRAFELSNLEIVIPIYRVAHAARDVDGRQLGENNTTPRVLFLDLPTQRKTCNYPGSRNQELPMNVTALKLMARRWPELLSLAEQGRMALFARQPPKDPSALRVGDVHFIAISQLAFAAYVLVRGVDPVPDGQLDGGLAAIFRLIDGVRLVTNELLREKPGIEGADTPLTAQGINEYAEHRAMFNGAWGVCAGPPALIEEYFRVLTGEQSAPIQVEPSLAERVGDLDAALDYALFGQRVEAAMRFLGSSQGLFHQRARALFEDQPRSELKDRLEVPIDVDHYPMLRMAGAITLEYSYRRELDVSRWLFARAGEGLTGKIDGASIDERVKLDPAAQAVAQRQLIELFTHALPADKALRGPICSELAAVVADAFALERHGIRVVEDEQGQLNRSLRRAAGRPLNGLDMAAYSRPRCGPPLHATLSAGLGVSITNDATATVIRYEDHSVTLTG